MSLKSLFVVAISAACGCGPAVYEGREARIDHVGLVAPDILGITISAGRVVYGRQVPHAKQARDSIVKIEVQRFVLRDGKVIGTLVGKAEDTLCTMDELVGEPFNGSWGDSRESFQISSTTDPKYEQPRKPVAVNRKSKPADLGMIGAFKFAAATENVVYLKLPSPLTAGKTYVVSFLHSGLPPYEFTFDPSLSRSEAVHISQTGFRPDDPVKLAFLSCWLGNGGGVRYEDGLPFSIVDEVTGAQVFRASTVLSKAASDKTEDAYAKNYNGTDVYAMDFSALTRPGRYRAYVATIGCSYPFEIAADVWKKAFIVSARGFYHQRSGIPLGEPFSAFRRPRPFHPDDGVKVFASKTPLIDTGNGLNQKDTNFGNLVKGKTDEIVPDAWGGYMDAGDWDRRIQHLRSSLLLLELADLFPDYFTSLRINIPESGNGLPDIVNEALFNLDFYRRMQTHEGGVRGGIESAEHPRRGEASFQESLTVMAYAPDVLSSYFYTGVAARAARWLASRDPKRAVVYRESALRAMHWSESDREREEKEFLMGKHPSLRDARNYAAAELFCLTGEARWNELFLATTLFTNPNVAPAVNFDSLDQRDSAWVYARTERPGVDSAIQANCRSVILNEAEERTASVDRTAFRWAKHPYGPVVFGALSSPENCVNVIRAHVLTGNPKYLRTTVLACQTGVGANPVNMCYTTGLGQKSPQHPLEIDHRITHQPPPPGLTVGGPMDNKMKGLADPFVGQFAAPAFTPPWQDWPALEAFWDVFWDPMVCEYTVHKPMAGNAYVWGYLAARGNPVSPPAGAPLKQ